MARSLLANMLASMLAALLVLAPLVAAQSIVTYYTEGHKDPISPVIPSKHYIPAGQPTGKLDRTIVNCNGGQTRPTYLYVAVTDSAVDTIYRDGSDGITIVRPVPNVDAPVYVEKQCGPYPPFHKDPHSPAPLAAA